MISADTQKRQISLVHYMRKLLVVMAWGLAWYIPLLISNEQTNNLLTMFTGVVFSLAGLFILAALTDREEWTVLDLPLGFITTLVLVFPVSRIIILLDLDANPNNLILYTLFALSTTALLFNLYAQKTWHLTWIPPRQHYLWVILLGIAFIAVSWWIVEGTHPVYDLITDHRDVMEYERSEIYIANSISLSGGENAIRIHELYRALWLRASGADSILQTFQAQAIFLAFLSLLAVYKIAALLGLPHPYPCIAVLAQVMLLRSMTSLLLPGGFFYQRLPENESAASFIAVFVAMICVIEALKQPSRFTFLFLAIGLLGATVTNPAQGIFVFVLVGVWALLLLVVQKTYILLFILFSSGAAISALAYYLLPSFIEQELYWHLNLPEQGIYFYDHGLTIFVDQTIFYTLKFDYVLYAAYIPIISSLLLSTKHIKDSLLSQYIFVHGSVLLLALLPLSAAIIGVLVRPYNMHRLLPMLPFGIATAFVVYALGQRISTRYRPRLHVATLLLLLVVLVTGQTEINHYIAVERYDPQFDLEALSEVGVFLDNQVTFEGTSYAVAGQNIILTELLNQVTGLAVPVHYRFWEDFAHSSWVRTLTYPEQREIAALFFLEQNVEYVVFYHDDYDIQLDVPRLARVYDYFPENFELVFSNDAFQVYEVLNLERVESCVYPFYSVLNDCLPEEEIEVLMPWEPTPIEGLGAFPVVDLGDNTVQEGDVLGPLDHALRGAFTLDEVAARGPEAQATVEAWRQDKSACHLSNLGIRYLLAPTLWIQWLSDAEYANLIDPNQYREIQMIHLWMHPPQEDEALYLYEVVCEAGP